VGVLGLAAPWWINNKMKPAQWVSSGGRRLQVPAGT
jgi:hypothetical protein